MSTRDHDRVAGPRSVAARKLAPPAGSRSCRAPRPRTVAFVPVVAPTTLEPGLRSRAGRPGTNARHRHPRSGAGAQCHAPAPSEPCQPPSPHTARASRSGSAGSLRSIPRCDGSRSVHRRSGVQPVLGFSRSTNLVIWLTGPCRHPFRAGSSPYPASWPRPHRWRPALAWSTGSCRLVARTGIRFRAILSRCGGGLSSRPGSRHAIKRVADLNGLPMCHTSETRPGRVPPPSRGSRCPPDRSTVLRSACAASQRSVPGPHCNVPSAGLHVTRHNAPDRPRTADSRQVS